MKVASNIVKQVLLTEKGTRLSELENKYLFKIIGKFQKQINNKINFITKSILNWKM